MVTTITVPPVLIVDDDSDIRETLGEVLRDAGYRVQEVPDGKPAQERLVVLLDLNMPSMDGRTVLHTVATQKSLATRHAYVLMTADEQALPRAFVALLTWLNVPLNRP